MLLRLFFVMLIGGSWTVRAFADELVNKQSPEFRATEKEEEDNFYRYKDIYLIAGKPDTKVQLSFKLKVIQHQNLYIGYTQLIFWHLGKEKSNPFRDVAYNPETYYSFKLGDGFWKYLSVGIEHRSNGKGEQESRSFDRAFIQSDNEFAFGDVQVAWMLRLFSFYDLDKTNRNLPKYYGFWETRLAFNGIFNFLPIKLGAYVHFFSGGRLSDKVMNGGREVGLRTKVRLFGVMPYLLMQAYWGHSESLLDYDKNVEAYRIGFLF